MAFPKMISIEKFSASDGVLLYGLFAMPERTRKRTAVIHVHGLAGSFYGGSATEGLARGFTSKGIAFFSMQTRGSNTIEQFYRLRGKRKVSFFAGGALEKFEDCVYDIDGAIKFLSSKGYKNIILEGHSTGCQKILYYCSKKKNRHVKAIVLLAPSDDYNISKMSLGRRFGAAVSYAKSAARINRNELMPSKYVQPWMLMSVSRFLSVVNLKKPESQILNYAAKRMRYVTGIRVPALAVIGTDDVTMNAAGHTAREAAEILTKNSNMVNAKVITGADHGFHGKSRKLVGMVMRWMQETLWN